MTENQETMRDALKCFSDAALDRFDSHAYAAGYLESTVVAMMADLPKRAQKQWIDVIVRAAQHQEAQLIATRAIS